MTLDEKFEKLKQRIRDTGGLAVAFSGGVDSTFLAAVSHQVLGERALAVTALSPTYPAHEQHEASVLAEQLGLQHETVSSNELEIPGFAQNPADRCYHCKKELFDVVREVAAQRDIRAVADGTNADDLDDYRPGRRAAAEGGVLSPLLDADMSKEDIRALSRQMGLPTAEKPAFACLASRFPYGSTITQEKLDAVDKVESFLRGRGYRQFRVRHHGDVARIELEPDGIPRMLDADEREAVSREAKAAGFLYVALDLQGYRTGSMNEAL